MEKRGGGRERRGGGERGEREREGEGEREREHQREEEAEGERPLKGKKLLCLERVYYADQHKLMEHCVPHKRPQVTITPRTHPAAIAMQSTKYRVQHNPSLPPSLPSSLPFHSLGTLSIHSEQDNEAPRPLHSIVLWNRACSSTGSEYSGTASGHVTIKQHHVETYTIPTTYPSQ